MLNKFLKLFGYEIIKRETVNELFLMIERRDAQLSAILEWKEPPELFYDNVTYIDFRR